MMYIASIYKHPYKTGAKPLEFYLFNKKDLSRASNKFNEMLIAPMVGGKYNLILGEGSLEGSIPQFVTLLDSVSFAVRKKRWERLSS